MERRDQRDPYRDQESDTWRRTESQRSGPYESGSGQGGRADERDRDYGSRGGYGQQYGERDRSSGQYQSGREAWAADIAGGRSASEGGRQYEQPTGGYGYGRQGYTAGQAGQGYYGARPMGEQIGRPVGGTENYGRGGGDESSRQYLGRGPRNYLRSDDRIRDDVCLRLTEDPQVDASNIEVVVSNREVTLVGTVASREQRRRAEDCSEQVSGVSHVQNNLRVSRERGWRSYDDAGGELARDETDSLISSDKVEGTAVYGSDRQKIGSVESLMLTKRGGKVAYAVLSFGGFLGLGTEHYPLPWTMLKYDTDLSGYIVNLTKDQLQNAPKYGTNEGWDWTDPATSRQIDRYYDQWMFGL